MARGDEKWLNVLRGASSVAIALSLVIPTAFLTGHYLGQWFNRRRAGKFLAACYEALGRSTKALPPLSTRERDIAEKTLVYRDELHSGLSAIGGLEAAKKELHQMITLPVTRPELFSGSRLLSQPKGVLLYGPPGTGKTMLARAVAHESGCAFLNVGVTTLHDMYIGESEKYAQAVFSLARKIAPCVIFIDEIDCLLSTRSGSDSVSGRHQNTLMSTIMTEWDGVESDADSGVVVLGATNRPQAVDPAILRRLPRQLCIPLPTEADRLQILNIILKDETLDPGVNLDAIAKYTAEYSGSDLSEMCKVAASSALHRNIESESGSIDYPLTLDDFRDALRRVQPTGRVAFHYHNTQTTLGDMPMD